MSNDRVAVDVLLVDGDSFEGRYVSSVLQSRGYHVLGPLDAACARLMLDARIQIGAALISLAMDASMAGPLLTELSRRAIPCLSLHGGRVCPDGEPLPLPNLDAPFAGYQVADWVAPLLSQPLRNENAVLHIT